MPGELNIQVWVNDLVGEIKRSLSSRTSATTVPDIDFYEFQMNRIRVRKFNELVNTIKKETVISRKMVGGFAIQTSKRPYSGANELKAFSGRKNVSFSKYKADYDTLVSLVQHKKNVILQGAPGVGKTYAAQRLAYSIMGVKDKERVMMVQFHQSYSYEDFIMGYRPTENGFERKAGAFYNFCKKAEVDSDNDYFFIIDEINRGNLSKIFGELFTFA